jgi:hypothetical protein
MTTKFDARIEQLRRELEGGGTRRRRDSIFEIKGIVRDYRSGKRPDRDHYVHIRIQRGQETFTVSTQYRAFPEPSQGYNPEEEKFKKLQRTLEDMQQSGEPASFWMKPSKGNNKDRCYYLKSEKWEFVKFLDNNVRDGLVEVIR